MLSVLFRDAAGYAWHDGEPFRLSAGHIQAAMSITIYGAELSYADDLVQRTDGALPHGLVVTLLGDDARALLTLILEDNGN